MTTACPPPPDLRALLETDDHELTLTEWAAYLADRYPLEYRDPDLSPEQYRPALAVNQSALVDVYRRRLASGEPLYHPDDYCQREECAHRGLLANGRNGIAQETGVIS